MSTRPNPNLRTVRVDGAVYAAAEDFEAHMHPDFDWLEPAEFGDEFERIARLEDKEEEQDMAAHTNVEPESYPGYINVSFDKKHGKAVVIVRGDPPVPVLGDDDTVGTPGTTATLILDISAWDLLVAQATRERAATRV